MSTRRHRRGAPPSIGRPVVGGPDGAHGREAAASSGNQARNRGRCDFCAGRYQLRRDGGVRVHTTGEYQRTAGGDWRPRYCPGSALPPRLDAGELVEQTHAALNDAVRRTPDLINNRRGHGAGPELRGEADGASDRDLGLERNPRHDPGPGPARDRER